MLLTSPIFDIFMIIIEIFVGLTPALNKVVDTSNESKIFVKISVFLLIALLLAHKKDIASVSEITANNILRYIFLGSISFIIMYCTQNGLKELPVETNLLVQQSFPVISTIIAYNILDRHQPIEYVPLFICAYILMIFILRPKPHHLKKIKKLSEEKKKVKWNAFLGLILAAFLSCILFMIFRLNIESYETGIIRMNLGAFIIIIGYFLYTKILPDTNVMNWLKLIGINLGIGYSLNKFRLVMRNSIPEVQYAIFVFLGTSIAFLLGELYPIFKRKAHPDFDKVITESESKK